MARRSATIPAISAGDNGIEPLATPKQIAGFLSTSEPNLGQLRYTGKGPKYIKLTGRQVRYRWSDVFEWVEAQTPRRRGPSRCRVPAPPPVGA
jgi:predicted DNA-binding transcriptional regulator AlpA